MRGVREAATDVLDRLTMPTKSALATVGHRGLEAAPNQQRDAEGMADAAAKHEIAA